MAADEFHPSDANVAPTDAHPPSRRERRGSGVLETRQVSDPERLRTLLDIAKQINGQIGIDGLLQVIVSESVRLLNADRGALFLVDPETGELWSKVAHGVGGEIRFPRGVGIAGAVVETGEVVNLQDVYEDPRFNAAIDRATGYRTLTLLCVPMFNRRGDVVGVVQVLNKRTGHFDHQDEDLLIALGGQAAAAVESALVHDEITQLFEGFVRAAVVAIESRDPSTAGHSERVARLTLGLADAVQQYGTPRWHDVRFSDAERMELRYAALLHDFGKVGVREDVLVKSRKLYPLQYELLHQRFQYAKKSLESAHWRRLVTLVSHGAPAEHIAAEEGALARQLADIDQLWTLVESCNRPTVQQVDIGPALTRLAQARFPGSDGLWHPLLTEQELELLSIPRGTLSAAERAEIESHVSHTFRFLAQIPWSRRLRRVPEIAFGHHETLDGSGYPRKLHGDQIQLEPRIMAIADIYDALTASDRPYKKALAHDAAVAILRQEAGRGRLDSELVALFADAQVAEQSRDEPSPAATSHSGVY